MEASQTPQLIRTLDPSDRASVREYVASIIGVRSTEESIDLLSKLVYSLGESYTKLATESKASKRGQRGGGSERYGAQTILGWQEPDGDGDPNPTNAESTGDVLGVPFGLDDAPRLEFSHDADEDDSALLFVPTPWPETLVAVMQAAPSPTTEPKAKPKRPKDCDADAKPAKPTGPRTFPASWPRVHDPEPIRVVDGLRTCDLCGLDKVCTCFRTREILEIVPPKVIVRVQMLEVLECPAGCPTKATAVPTASVTPDGRLGFSTAVDLIVRKHEEHSPHWRTEQVYEGVQIDIPMSTIYLWADQAIDQLAPLAAALRNASTADTNFLVNVDDTSMRVLERDDEQAGEVGHLWVTIGDARYIGVHFTPDWTKESAISVVGDRVGYLQADAYKGFDVIYKRGKAVEIGCWAHARRYLVKAHDRGDERAREGLTLVAKLYALEASVPNEDLARRTALRRGESARTLANFWSWVQRESRRVEPRSALGKAFTYLKNQRTALSRFLDDARIPLDNTVSERQVKPIVLGRKNYLFAKTVGGAVRLSDAYTVIANARSHGVEVRAYLLWVLPQLSRREWSEAEIRRKLFPDAFIAHLKKEREEGLGGAG